MTESKFSIHSHRTFLLHLLANKDPKRAISNYILKYYILSTNFPNDLNA
ncbi:hypothetical protein HMPREF1988_01358 [Porphyromonas gingivalis F0185]|nr:hypothetical protein HMPREF1988_01358 [Porphyromonas gingivalis F0185]